MAGICLIRLEQMRPRFAPPVVGLTSENAAHRIAVEWDEHGTRREGVYIPRRDTSSRLSVLASGHIIAADAGWCNRVMSMDTLAQMCATQSAGEPFFT
jgi:hypothetical protein